ncbi:MAG: DUF4102 domain-containing protein [Gammaproteobacteria bacterium]|nr:DUF4102 domain-containing protein [Gammaproteobacteria bacterium]
MTGLTNRSIRSLKPSVKPRRAYDTGGLYMEITPQGGRYWRLKYYYGGTEKRLALGVYPEISLAEARHKRDVTRALLRDGQDPAAIRKAERLRSSLAGAESFEAVAREWLAKQKTKLSPATFGKAIWTFEKLLFPWLGAQSVSKITPAELLATLRRTESRGRHETTHRAKQRASQVFRYAIATGRAERDPSADLKGALHPVVSKQRAAITEPAKVAALLRAIHSYAGTFVTCSALKLAPMLFVRPGELRRAEWAEINFDSAEWRIPAAKMKMREEHIVPLPTQAVGVLRELHPLTGRGRYVFPGVRSSTRPMSENTITAALRNMGYDRHTMTGHGFRALASTRLNEMGWAPDVIERQLAHVERNKVRSVYNRALYLKERRKMMQTWADYLDGLAKGANVVPIKAARSAK